MCRRWGTSQNFCLANIDKLEKELLIKKMMSGQKKCKNFNINVVFFLKNSKTHFET